MNTFEQMNGYCTKWSHHAVQTAEALQQQRFGHRMADWSLALHKKESFVLQICRYQLQNYKENVIGNKIIYIKEREGGLSRILLSSFNTGMGLFSENAFRQSNEL
jgi:hypothetical protein